MNKDIDWIIHFVSETEPCDMCGDNKKETTVGNITYTGFDCFCNIHTHGFNKHNHREMCIPFELNPNVAMGILNNCGLKIANFHEEFKEGICHGVLRDEYDVKFISFKDDPTLYMILPDKNNKFPGDEDCEYPYCQQEIYAKIISDGKDYV